MGDAEENNVPMTKAEYGRSPTREILADCKRLAAESNEALEESNETGARMLSPLVPPAATMDEWQAPDVMLEALAGRDPAFSVARAILSMPTAQLEVFRGVINAELSRREKGEL